MAQRDDIPHVAACGGKGVCSTCRVEVLEGLNCLSPRTEAEAAIAVRRGWPDHVRLACEARLMGAGPVRLRHLITPPQERKRRLRQEKQEGLGKIQPLAVLFADMRNFTPITEANPAFDVVYMLNRYFATLERAITANGGRVNLWVGDEISAIFGLEEDPRIACHQAVDAALAMLRGVEVLSRVMEKEFGVSLSIGVGIHFGPVIVGMVGPAHGLKLGLVGDCVNVASRLQMGPVHQLDLKGVVSVQGSGRTVAGLHADRASLSDQGTIQPGGEFRALAAARASPHRGDGRSRPAPGTARHHGSVV